uniref:Uncharacterized protein n=1 Tax=Arundo donax TaxID=35708 RepID=A0A0A9GNH3_ARUDO
MGLSRSGALKRYRYYGSMPAALQSN